MGHKDLGIRRYNPSLAAQNSKKGKAFFAKIRAMEPYERLLYWIAERHAIYQRRFPKGFGAYLEALGDGRSYIESPISLGVETQRPWTDDPILQTVFFCNVYRENDRVTSFLRDHFRQPERDNPCVFIGTILLRWYNYIPTMARLINANVPQKLTKGKQATQALSKATKMLVELRDDHGEQLFGGAYIIRPIVDGEKGTRKVESIAKLMQSMIDDPTLYQELIGEVGVGNVDLTLHQHAALGGTTDSNDPGSMSYAFARLRQFSGMGKFYNYQFIGDLAYTHVLRDAPDWFTWGFCGPGTSRGLVRLKCPSGRAKLPNGNTLPRLMPLQRGWQQQLLDLQTQLNKDLGLSPPKGKAAAQHKEGGEVRSLQYIHMRDLCNCLCEYDKYERALFNERSIKRPYRGT